MSYSLMTNLSYLFQKLKGGAGSGNWGHAGIVGHRGGSSPRSFAMSRTSGRDWQERQQAKVEATKAPAKPFEFPVNKETEAKAEKYVTNLMNGPSRAAQALVAFENLLKDAPVCTRVPAEVLEKILDEGRFRNQHETRTSGGMMNPERRKRAEQIAFGEHLEKPNELPIYGYMSTGKNGFQPFTVGYGNVKIQFKPQVKDRTTVTAGDSLRPFEDKQAVGTPANKPRVASLDSAYFDPSRQELSVSGYVEAQIHGGITTKDIEKVIIPKKTGFGFREDQRERVLAALKKHNIPYEEAENEAYLDD